MWESERCLSADGFPTSWKGPRWWELVNAHPPCLWQTQERYRTVLFTHNCVSKHSSNVITLLPNDTTVVGSITNNDQPAYREDESTKQLVPGQSVSASLKGMIVDCKIATWNTDPSISLVLTLKESAPLSSSVIPVLFFTQTLWLPWPPETLWGISGVFFDQDISYNAHIKHL